MKAFSWRFVTPLLMGSALNPINSSMIATALVPIAAAMHVSVGRTATLVTALYLASSIALPTGGKLAEEFGPRRVFLTGIVIVFAGGIVGGVATSLTTLIVSRVLIGIGTSAGYPSAMLLIRRRAESAGLTEPPGSVLGGLQIAGTVTAAVGLPLGGVLVDAWGWRTTFFINVPFALVALVMTVLWIPRDPPVTGSRNARDMAARIDVRAAHPFFDVRLLGSNLALIRTYLRFALTSLCLYAVLYGLTQWLEAGRGVSAREAGLLVLPMSALASIVVRPISSRNLVRGPLIVAAVSSLVASVGVLFVTTGTATIWILAITLVFGVTLGTYASGNQTALYQQVSASQLGTASGLFRTFGYLGSIGSSALTGIVFHSRVDDHGLHVIAVAMIAISAVTLLLTLADRRLRSPARVRPEAPLPVEKVA